MKRPILRLSVVLALGLGLTLALLTLTGKASQPASAASPDHALSVPLLEVASPTTRYVAVAGSDATTCATPVSPCRTVQL